MKGRLHDNRHTLVTELAESGVGDEVIMSIAGHVSRAMLSRYSAHLWQSGHSMTAPFQALLDRLRQQSARSVHSL